ncbi:MAG: hypothetical protein ACRCUU_12505, partial [Plesiomonas sp.]
MNTFTLTLPANDPIALNAFSRALREMAVAHGAPVSEVTERVGDISVTEKILTSDYERDHITVLDTTVNPPVIVSGPED